MHCSGQKGFLRRKQRRSGGPSVRPAPGTRCGREEGRDCRGDEGGPEDRFPVV